MSIIWYPVIGITALAILDFLTWLRQTRLYKRISFYTKRLFGDMI